MNDRLRSAKLLHLSEPEVVNGKSILSSNDVLGVLQITQKLPEILDRGRPLGPTVASVDVILGKHLDTSCLFQPRCSDQAPL
jgi:hypothetical protein